MVVLTGVVYASSSVLLLTMRNWAAQNVSNLEKKVTGSYFMFSKIEALHEKDLFTIIQ